MKKVVAKKKALAVKKASRGIKAIRPDVEDLGHRIQLFYTFVEPGKILRPKDIDRGGYPANGPILGPPTPPHVNDRILRWRTVETISWPTGDFAVEIGLRFVPKSQLS